MIKQEIQFLEVRGKFLSCLFLAVVYFTHVSFVGISFWAENPQNPNTKPEKQGKPRVSRMLVSYPDGYCFNSGFTYPTTISRPQNISTSAAFWKEMKESGVRVNPKFTSQLIGYDTQKTQPKPTNIVESCHRRIDSPVICQNLIPLRPINYREEQTIPPHSIYRNSLNKGTIFRTSQNPGDKDDDTEHVKNHIVTLSQIISHCTERGEEGGPCDTAPTDGIISPTRIQDSVFKDRYSMPPSSLRCSSVRSWNCEFLPTLGVYERYGASLGEADLERARVPNLDLDLGLDFRLSTRVTPESSTISSIVSEDGLPITILDLGCPKLIGLSGSVLTSVWPRHQ